MSYCNLTIRGFAHAEQAYRADGEKTGGLLSSSLAAQLTRVVQQ